jgi:hypothetical protein
LRLFDCFGRLGAGDFFAALAGSLLLAVLEVQLWFADAIVGALGDLGDGGGEADRKAEGGDKDSIFIIMKRGH